MSDQVVVGQAVAPIGLPPAASAELAVAAAQLRGGKGVLVRMADLVGGLMGRSVRMGVRRAGLAPEMQEKLQGIAAAALRRAFELAVLGLDREQPIIGKARFRQSYEVTRAVVVMSGAVGGFLGLGGFIPDVTVTTFAIMRSIARIAQEEGEDLTEEEARRACLQVFALAPENDEQPESDFGYFSARLVMQGRPLVLLLSEVAGRYGISVSQKLALQAVPFVGAAGGAALNAAFLRHYRDAARAHFVIRRLERLHGSQAVRQAWSSLQAA
jgi:hypothetical protein